MHDIGYAAVQRPRINGLLRNSHESVGYIALRRYRDDELIKFCFMVSLGKAVLAAPVGRVTIESDSLVVAAIALNAAKPEFSSWLSIHCFEVVRSIEQLGEGWLSCSQKKEVL